MSLLATTNSGNNSATQAYFVKNLSKDGLTPQIDTNAVGTVLIQPSGASVADIRNAASSAGTLRIGSSTTSFQNITLTDGNTLVNTELDVAQLVHADGDMEIGGNFTFINGSIGKSISGYYNASVPVVGAVAVPNPAGLTNGVYLAVYIGDGAGNEKAQPSGVFYYNTVGGWSGNAVSFNFTAGAPNCALGPVAGGATLEVAGASVPATGTVYFRKLLN